MQFIPHREHHVFSLEGPVYEGCGKIFTVFSVRPGGMCTNHWALKGSLWLL